MYFISVGIIQGSLWYTILFAIAGDACGAHIGHDGGHFALSSKYPWMNDIGLWGICLITNPITWQHEHTYGHHSFTTDEHKDPDMQPFKGAFKLRPNEILGPHFMSSIENLKKLDKDKKYFFWFVIMLFCQSSLGLCYLGPFLFVFHRSSFS